MARATTLDRASVNLDLRLPLAVHVCQITTVQIAILIA
jgi:hypothetical protein